MKLFSMHRIGNAIRRWLESYDKAEMQKYLEDQETAKAERAKIRAEVQKVYDDLPDDSPEKQALGKALATNIAAEKQYEESVKRLKEGMK